MTEQKPKLLVLASTFPRTLNDSEPRFIYDLCIHLMPWFDITVLVPSYPGAPPREMMDGLAVVRFRYAPNRLETLAYPGAIMSRIYEKKKRALLVPGFLLGMYAAIRKLCKTQKIDVVHAHWLIPQGIIQSLLAKPGSPPYLLTGHGADVCSLNKGVIKKLKQRAVSKADAMTIVSEYLKNELLSHYTVNSPLTVCPMGCDLTAFRKDKHAAGYFKEHYGINGPVILFVGRLAEKKGVRYLLEALTLEPLKSTAAHVVIAGDGQLREELTKQAGAPELAGRVTFIGSKTHVELPVIYASADVLCAPSITASDGDKESWGVVIIEAAASGLPVVTTKRGKDETVLDGKTGFTVLQKDAAALSVALAKLLNSREMRKKMGAAAAEYARQFGWETIAQVYRDILNKIIAANGKEV